jgi:hypothetical protein
MDNFPIAVMTPVASGKDFVVTDGKFKDPTNEDYDANLNFERAKAQYHALFSRTNTGTTEEPNYVYSYTTLDAFKAATKDTTYYFPRFRGDSASDFSL